MTNYQSMAASSFTKTSQKEVYNYLNFEDNQDFEDARRGFIAPFETIMKDDKGNALWESEDITYLDTAAPDTVNPSLWRNAQLHAITGLFKVVDGVYQVRAQSVSTTFIIEGKSGIIVCDTSINDQVAKASMELYYEHRPKKPVTAIIISQTHADHWGGMLAVLEYAINPEIPIIVPEHFTKEALSESVLLGTIMWRRAAYQAGAILPNGPKGYVSFGIGHRYPPTQDQTSSFEMPTIEINNENETQEVDGITFDFLLTPNTEAPAEMHFYIREYKALFVSENVNKTIHQIYTVRGAKTRDALAWSNAINTTINLFKDKEIDALLMIHASSIWGKERALYHLKMQRDLYKYMHDQTVRLANHGYTMDEIAETIQLPDSLNKYWGNRGYYGTLKHNSKGIYNFYLGYYSGHPSDLDPLPQVETGHKYVEYMGGAENVVKQAKADYEKGEYRWVAQVLKNVIMSNPDHIEAKDLLANTYDQLGYQAESSIWRNFYLVGGFELRNGLAKRKAYKSSIALNMPIEEFFKLLAVKLNGPKADGKQITINVTLKDVNQNYTIYLENSVLNNRENQLDPNPDVALTVDKSTFYTIMLGIVSLEQAQSSNQLEVSGDSAKLNDFLALLDDFTPQLNIVTP